MGRSLVSTGGHGSHPQAHTRQRGVRAGGRPGRSHRRRACDAPRQLLVRLPSRPPGAVVTALVHDMGRPGGGHLDRSDRRPGAGRCRGRSLSPDVGARDAGGGALVRASDGSARRLMPEPFSRYARPRVTRNTDVRRDLRERVDWGRGARSASSGSAAAMRFARDRDLGRLGDAKGAPRRRGWTSRRPPTSCVEPIRAPVPGQPRARPGTRPACAPGSVPRGR